MFHNMIKFKEGVVHIGTPKTGTTTLQLFFHKNREILAKHGIFYPNTFGKRGQSKLTAYAQADNIIGELRTEFGLTNIKLIKNFRKEIKNSFEKEIENHNCSKLLLSGEDMSARLSSIEEIQFLKTEKEAY